MRKALPVLIAVSSGCLQVEPSQRVDATWSLERLDDGEQACPATWREVRLVNAATDRPEAHTVDRFACTDRGGRSSQLAQGAYTSWLEFVDADDRVVATSLPQSIEVGPFTTDVASTVYLDAGYASLAWSYDDEPFCGDSFNPLQWIQLSLTGPTTITSLFSCHDRQGLAGPFPPGRYTVWVGQGLIGHDRPAITIEAPNRVTVLPAETF